MTTEISIPELVNLLAWPSVVLITLLVFGGRLIKLVTSFSHVEVTSKAINVTLKRLEREYSVPKIQIEKLNGLSGHDLWALEAFVKPPNDTFRYVKHFNAQRRAIVHSFLEMGLLEIVGEREARYVRPTKLANDLIDAANKLLAE